MTFKNNKIKKKNKKRKFFSIFMNNPFVRGIILKLLIVTPKKPNSARRPVCKINLINGFKCLSHIPGIGHNLRKHCVTLIKINGARDLPGVNFSCIRGVYDFSGIQNKIKRKSIYGSKNNSQNKKLRKKFRQK